MKSKTAVLCGLLLITIGVVLFWANARRNIKLIIDGKPRQVATYKITVGQILKETGIDFNELDRIFPEINYWMTEKYFLKVDHLKAIHLVSSGGQKDYSTFENLAGNILADGEVALYPGDQIRWNGTQIQPDFNLGSLKAINLEVVRGDPFELITDLGKQRQQFYTDATTVGEALRQTAVRIPPDSIIVPAEDTPFTAGMIIQILEKIPFVLVSKGDEIPLTGYGTNAGELLASAGYPLQGL
ncbi:MAG TPA: ubiquitin-like domain-containing protein, partial [Flexilinea sp.]|nr:ubiquitin-like domain-containing protein [Flexilinea sp.]